MIGKTMQRSLSITVRNPVKVTKKAKMPTIVQTQSRPAMPVRDYHANAIKLESLIGNNQSGAAAGRFPFFRNKLVGQ